MKVSLLKTLYCVYIQVKGISFEFSYSSSKKTQHNNISTVYFRKVPYESIAYAAGIVTCVISMNELIVDSNYEKVCLVAQMKFSVINKFELLKQFKKKSFLLNSQVVYFEG